MVSINAKWMLNQRQKFGPERTAGQELMIPLGNLLATLARQSRGTSSLYSISLHQQQQPAPPPTPPNLAT